MVRRLISTWCALFIVLSVMLFNAQAQGAADKARVAGGTNVDMVLLIDRSGSMNASDPEDLRMLAAEFLICLARLGDQLGVVGFDDRLDPIEPLRLLASQADRDVLVEAVRKSTARRFTDISRALREGYDQLSMSSSPNPKAVILLTDGRHTTGPYEEEAIRYRDRGWKIFTIGWGENVDIDFLRDISGLTGGQYFYGFSCAALRAIYADMAGYEPRASECDALCQQLEDWAVIEARGRIRGIVYQDTDQDGVFDPDEGGLADIGVTIYSGAWSAFAETTWNGSFEFAALSLGYYDVEIVVPEGYRSTGLVRLERVPVELGSLTSSGVDFGLANNAKETTEPAFMPVTGAEPVPDPRVLSAFVRDLPPGSNVMRTELASGAVVVRVWVRGSLEGEYLLR